MPLPRRLARLAPALVVLAALASCAGPPVVLHNMAVSEGAYSFAGHQLQWIAATPDIGELDKVPVAVMLEGDGAGCQEFDARRWRTFVTKYAGNFTLVRPVTAINRLCDTPAFGRLDFSHRQRELVAIMQSVRAAFGKRPLVLIGHSAGAALAVLHANAHPGQIAGVVNLSGGIDALDDVKRGLCKNDACRAEADAWMARMRLNKHVDEPDKVRSPKFFAQMLDLPVAEAWLKYQGPLLLLHGEHDNAVPIALVRASLQRIPLRPNLTVRLEPTWGHAILYKRDTWIQIDAWLRQTKLP